MTRAKKPTRAQAQRIFDDRVAELLEQYRRALAAAKGHPTLTTYWRHGYTVSQHRVTGHWVVRAGKKMAK